MSGVKLGFCAVSLFSAARLPIGRIGSDHLNESDWPRLPHAAVLSLSWKLGTSWMVLPTASCSWFDAMASTTGAFAPQWLTVTVRSLGTLARPVESVATRRRT